MNKIKNVRIDGFWTEKVVDFHLKDDVNFLIGMNGSGKTTIINLIAATLNADFATLDRIPFNKIKIDLVDRLNMDKYESAYIEVEKKEKSTSPYPKIIFKIKNYHESNFQSYNLEDLEEEHFIRFPNDFFNRKRFIRGGLVEHDVNIALQELINVSWLSIHRTNSYTRKREEHSYESTIDMKIEELQHEFIKYFSQLNRKLSKETEIFQKFIFESLLDTDNKENSFDFVKYIDAEKEQNSLKEIFGLFKLNETTIKKKLDAHFQEYKKSLKKINKKELLDIKDLSFLLGTRRIHSVVQEWTELIKKQQKINEPKDIFLNVINKLLQKKQLVINETNELIVQTESSKKLSLRNLSSGEKQLLIILGQSLLQESKTHIYIADEPELSLHVEWQEKLVKSLKSLNHNSQIIFATHSPDIVGEFSSSVINVEDVIK